MTYYHVDNLTYLSQHNNYTKSVTNQQLIYIKQAMLLQVNQNYHVSIDNCYNTLLSLILLKKRQLYQIVANL